MLRRAKHSAIEVVAPKGERGGGEEEGGEEEEEEEEKEEEEEEEFERECSLGFSWLITGYSDGIS